MTRIALAFLLLPGAAAAQAVASDADCRYYAEQAAFAAQMRDQGQGRAEVAPGLAQSGLGDGIVELILDTAFDGNAFPPETVAEAVYQQCSTGFR